MANMLAFDDDRWTKGERAALDEAHREAARAAELKLGGVDEYVAIRREAGVLFEKEFRSKAIVLMEQARATPTSLGSRDWVDIWTGMARYAASSVWSLARDLEKVASASSVEEGAVERLVRTQATVDAHDAKNAMGKAEQTVIHAAYTLNRDSARTKVAAATTRGVIDRLDKLTKTKARVKTRKTLLEAFSLDDRVDAAKEDFRKAETEFEVAWSDASDAVARLFDDSGVSLRGEDRSVVFELEKAAKGFQEYAKSRAARDDALRAVQVEEDSFTPEEKQRLINRAASSWAAVEAWDRIEKALAALLASVPNHYEERRFDNSANRE